MFKIKSPGGLNNLCGKNLRRIRLAQDPPLSQRGLTKLLQLKGLDLDYHFIRRIEAGQRYVTDIEIVMLSKVLHISLEELIGDFKGDANAGVVLTVMPDETSKS